MKRIIPFLLILSIFISCAKQNISLITQENFEQALQSLSLEYGGTIGIAAKNFKTGETISVNADSLFPTASVIKLPILVEFFHKVKYENLSPNLVVNVPDSVKVDGAGILQFFDSTAKIKLVDAATLMIILSDNTATNLIIDALGNQHDEKLEAVNNRMETLGLYNTKLLNKVFSYATKKNTPEAKRFGLGYTSPNNMLKLLEMIYRHQVIDSVYSEKIISIMKNQQDDTMIRRFLPYDENISVANKTGAVDRSRIDVGLIYSPKSDIGLAIFADQSKDTRWTHDNKAQNAVAIAGRMIYNYFTRDK